MANEPVVFIVDDEPMVLSSTAALMRSAGLPVQTFISAEEFLTAFRPGQLGCLLLDVRLSGMSGIELLRHLRDRDVELPVILISGHATEEIRHQALANGAVDLLDKPLKSRLLVEKVRDAMSGFDRLTD